MKTLQPLEGGATVGSEVLRNHLPRPTPSNPETGATVGSVLVRPKK